MENLMKMIAAVFLSTFAFGAAIAQTPGQPASPPASKDASGPAMASTDAKRDSAVEKHIAELHRTLKITAAEESQWNEVAETMRLNARDLDRAIDARDASRGSATAIDDLNSYAEIAQVHANSVKKLAGAFSVLYAAMSTEQKEAADEAFGHRGHETRKVAQR
jgi:periplasmic protein CpxP/Spy